MASAVKRTFSLPPEHTAFIDEQVASGSYASASEVVRAGLRALQERDAAVERWLLREVAPVYVLETDTGRTVAELDAIPSGRGAVAFSPDGRRVAVLAGGGLVRVWDVATAGPVFDLDGASEAVAYSPDGSRLATTGEGRFATLWDAETGHRLCTLPGPGGRSILFDREGRWLITDKSRRFAPTTSPRPSRSTSPRRMFPPTTTSATSRIRMGVPRASVATTALSRSSFPCT